MIALPKHKMTAGESLAWAETLPKEAGKFELWDGEVIVKHGPAGQMNAERSQHWEVKGAAYWVLHDAIRRSGLPCHAATGGAGVRLSSNWSRPPVTYREKWGEPRCASRASRSSYCS